MDGFLGAVHASHPGPVSPSPNAGVATAYAAEHSVIGEPLGGLGRSVAPLVGRWSVWAQGGAGSMTIDGQGSAPSLHSHDAAVLAGAEYLIDSDLVVGAAIGGARVDWGLGDDSGNGRTDAVHVGLHARRQFGPMFVSATFAYARYDMETVRTGQGTVAAHIHADSVATRVEVGREHVIEGMSFTPHVALQLQNLWLPGYSETASASAAWDAASFADRSIHEIRSELGVHASRSFVLPDRTTLSLGTRLAWGHEFSVDRSVEIAYVTAPTTPFSLAGAAPDRDALLVSGNAAIHLPAGLAMTAKIEAQLSANVSAYAGMAGLAISW